VVTSGFNLRCWFILASGAAPSSAMYISRRGRTEAIIESSCRLREVNDGATAEDRVAMKPWYKAPGRAGCWSCQREGHDADKKRDGQRHSGQGNCQIRSAGKKEEGLVNQIFRIRGEQGGGGRGGDTGCRTRRLGRPVPQATAKEWVTLIGTSCCGCSREKWI
jgi:hypothetical protein